MTSKRRVAVTATAKETEGVPRVRLNQSYVRALEIAGLVPLVIPPLGDATDGETVLEAAHGLVLTGGEDIEPSRYGAVRRPQTHAAHAARDTFELALTHAARRLGVPTLAICRGVQVVNVAFGGTLVQDIPIELPHALAHETDAPRDARVHDVAITPGSRLAAAAGTTLVRVNSSHHQALARIGDGLRVTAAAPDGIIEGVEWGDGDWWMVGVQWHPEELVDTPERWDRRLFDAFAAECAARAAVTA